MANLIIIDDEPGVARIVEKVAVSQGYQVTLTTEPERFMDEVAAVDPDVVVMDLAIPGTDGVQLLRFLATARCDARIVLISGFDARVLETTARLGNALGLRIAGTISKPIRVAELSAVLERLTETNAN